MHILVDKILTNYEVIGDGDEVILILHGWKRSLNEWVPIAQNLSSRYRIILLDLPGFGGTSQSDKSYDTYEYATFVENFLKKLDINRYSLIGHSFGGRLGIIISSRSNAIKKLILVDSAGIENKPFHLRLLNLFINPVKKFIPEKVKSKFGSSDYKSSGKLKETFVKVVNQDLTHLFNKVKVPTIIIWGDKDSVLDVSQTKVFKKEIPNSTVRIVWGAGHSPHIEKPKAFLDILNEYL